MHDYTQHRGASWLRWNPTQFSMLAPSAILQKHDCCTNEHESSPLHRQDSIKPLYNQATASPRRDCHGSTSGHVRTSSVQCKTLEYQVSHRDLESPMERFGGMSPPLFSCLRLVATVLISRTPGKPELLLPVQILFGEPWGMLTPLSSS